MKKTIIALMALAGVVYPSANGEVLTMAADAKKKDNGENTNYSVENGIASLSGANIKLKWEENYQTLSSWQITLTIYPDRTAFENIEIINFNSGSGNLRFAMNDDGTLEFYAGAYTSTNGSNVPGWSVVTDNSILSLKTNTTLTLSYVANQDKATNEIKGGVLTATTSNGDTILIVKTDSNYELTNNTAVLWTNTNKDKYTGISIAKLDNKMIPEPTTATLSLLALAGLAARRRRR